MYIIKGGEELAKDRASKLRYNLTYNINHPNHTMVYPTNGWHFNEYVYKRDIYGKKLNRVELPLIHLRTKKYKEVLSNSRYSLCPRGIGPASIRFWESLGAGAIPVNISDDFWLPGEDYFNWDSCVVTVKEKDILDIPDISKEQEHELRENALNVFKMFTGENFISPIKHKLLGVFPELD